MRKYFKELGGLVGGAMLLSFATGCFAPKVTPGLKCSADGKCPSGYYCASDNVCWQNGQGPASPAATSEDAGVAQMVPVLVPDAGVVRTAHSGLSTPSGGTSAKSEHYKLILSVGQAPGGNSSAAASTKRLTSGLPGATQKK